MEWTTFAIPLTTFVSWPNHLQERLNRIHGVFLLSFLGCQARTVSFRNVRFERR
jgi:hypothetical protein